MSPYQSLLIEQDQMFVTSLQEVRTQEETISWGDRLKRMVRPARVIDEDEPPQTEWSKQASSVSPPHNPYLELMIRSRQIESMRRIIKA